MERARKFIEENATDPETALAKLRAALARKEKGTLADLTQDQGIFDVEAGVPFDHKTKAKMSDLADEYQQGGVDKITETFGDGVPIDAQAAAQARAAEGKALIHTTTGDKLRRSQAAAQPELDALDEVADSSLTRAVEAHEASVAADDVVDAAARELETAKRPYETGAETQEAVQAAKDAYQKKVVTPAYEAFEAQKDIATGPLKSTIGTRLDNMKGKVRKKFEAKFGKDYEDFLDVDSLSPQEYQLLEGDLRTTLSKAIEDKSISTVMREELSGMIDDLDAALQRSNPLYKEAKDAAAEGYRRFGDEKISRALQGSPELFDTKMGYKGGKGAETVRQLDQTGVGDISELNYEQLKAAAADKGTIDQKFLRDHAAALDSLPEEQADQFRNYADAIEEAAEATKTATRVGKADDAVQAKALRDQTRLEKSLGAEQKVIKEKGRGLKNAVAEHLTSQYGNAPAATLDKLLSSTDNIPALRRLQKKMAALGKEADFKADVGNHLKQKLSKNEGGEYLRILEESGVLSGDELVEIQRAVNRTRSVTNRKKAVAAHQALGGDEMQRLAASAIAASAMTVAPGSSSLIMANAMRRAVFKLIKTGKSPKDIKALEEFVMNPQAYADAAAGARSTDEAVRSILTRIVAGTQTAEALQDEEQ